ncbi:MAG TPA: lamin tail domain-containing protein, partial [Chitinophagaceae bacterium]|nr:lamin tail domain-containing protein [Chitinophagaceae bacterium]
TYYIKAFTRRGTNWSTGVEINVTPAVAVLPGEILINQVSPDYGAASDEYIELVNTTNKTFDLSTLAIRYQAASGSSGSAGGTLSGTLLPHQYWLLSPNATITVGLTNALARDGSFTSGFAHPSGQIALVRISDNVIIDGVGYGTITGGTYTEGTASASSPTDGGIKRTVDGVDTDNNSADFSTVANASILLRNSSSTPLPVKFANVRAYQQGNGIKVEWSNLTETNVLNYKVERSASGQTFLSLSDVAAFKNDGGRADYSFFDALPVDGVNLYRIQATEADGRKLYSVIVRVDTKGGKMEITIYPNPVSGSQLSLQATELPKGLYTVQVYNAGGQQVHSLQLNHNGGSVTEMIQLPSSLHSGMYNLHISNGEVKLGKIFIVR